MEAIQNLLCGETEGRVAVDWRYVLLENVHCITFILLSLVLKPFTTSEDVNIMFYCI